MKLRVIVPTLGNSTFLRQTIESIRVRAAQVDLHCIVVTRQTPSALLQGLDFATVVMEPEGFVGGLYGAINLGAYSPGDWTHITYINDDDGLSGNWKTRCGTADVQYGRVEVIYSERRSLSYLTVCKDPRRLPGIWHWSAPGLYQQGTIISKRIFDAVGGFDEGYKLAADHAFWLKAWRHGAQFEYIDRPVGFFRIRPGQLSGNLNGMRKEIARATKEVELRAGPWERLVGYAYWRYLAMPSLLQRMIRRYPVRTLPGS